MKDLEWFKQKIGKTIYRDSDGCSCPTCERIVENGLTVADEQHAEYIFDIQNEWAQEGIYLNYRDKKSLTS